MQATIVRQRPDTADSLTLIAELEAYLTPLYPNESQFGYSPERLLKENVAFFLVKVDGLPVGCGAVKLYRDFGEVKRMYIRPEFRGHGLARIMLQHLETYAFQHGLKVMRLETGVHQPEAVRLYEKAGYYKIQSFEPYPKDLPLSLFYEKQIG